MNEVIEHQGGQGITAAQGTMIQDLTRAEINQQIATAKEYPRSLTLVSRNINSLVTISATAAEKCMYSLPRGGKSITGPSIRMAEIIVSQWGNCRVGARVVHVDRKEKFVEAEAIFHDLETNTATAERVRRRISDKNGRLFNDDMIIVTGNACKAIAKRNAILSGIPEVIWGDPYEQALKMMRGDTVPISDRRDAAMKAMSVFGLGQDQVFKILGVAGMDDINIDQLVKLKGFQNALKEEQVTVVELLRQAEAASEPKRRAGSITSDAPKERKPNPEADAAMQAEAEAAEKRRQAAAQKEKDDAEEFERLKVVYRGITEKDPDGRWNLDTLAEKVEEAKEALRNPKPENEEPREEAQEKDTGDRGGEPDPRDQAFDPGEDGHGSRAHDAFDAEKVYNDIVNDLMSNIPLADVKDMYADKIETLKAVAPETHARLMEEFEEV